MWRSCSVPSELLVSGGTAGRCDLGRTKCVDPLLSAFKVRVGGGSVWGKWSQEGEDVAFAAVTAHVWILLLSSSLAIPIKHRQVCRYISSTSRSQGWETSQPDGPWGQNGNLEAASDPPSEGSCHFAIETVI